MNWRKTFSNALKAAGLGDTLSGKGPFTVFVPTDAAFAKLQSPKTLKELLKPENKAALVKLLKYHIVPSAVFPKDLKNGDNYLQPLEANSTIVVTKTDNKVTVNEDANVAVISIINVSNGVIYTIDKVLYPGFKP